jgi:ribokinase
VVEEDNITEVPAPNVEAVDPTGAGDAFCGALAQSLAQGGSLQESVRRAVAAGAVAVTRRGAQTAMPNRAEVDALIRGDTLR